jgi:hypothetical protein
MVGGLEIENEEEIETMTDDKQTTRLDSETTCADDMAEDAKASGLTLFFGIMDCHGVESFKDYESQKGALGMLMMRAQANRHRHALVYFVPLDDERADHYDDRFKKAKDGRCYHSLCVDLQNENAFGCEHGMAESLALIPADELDVWNR